MIATRRSYFQLISLVMAHFTVDMLGGVLPGFLPVLREKFGLSLGSGVLLLAILGIGSNICQLPAGMARKKERLPMLIQIGLGLAAIVLVFALAPAGTPLWVLALAVFVAGAGIALVHPEGLRGTLAIKGIPETISTSCFMVAGFAGFASGAFIGATLVGAGGISALLWMLPLPFLVIWAVHSSRVRLAIHARQGNQNSAVASEVPWSFAEIFAIAVFMNAGSSTMQGLLPSYLNEMGFTLRFSGMSAMFFGIGSAIGSLVFSVAAHKYRPARFIMVAMAIGLPVILCYFAFASHASAVWLAIPAGLLLSAGFPLLVVLARTAPGRLALGMRMAMIVGGSWATATGIFLLIGQIADRIGLAKAMNFVWVCYGMALAIALFTYFRRKHPRTKSVSTGRNF